MDATKQIQMHSKHKDLTCTVQEAIDAIRRGNLFANYRLASLILPALFDSEVRLDEHYNGKEMIRVVDRGVLVEEYRTWKEAILARAEECGL